ncbi:MAG TPA: dihydropteroate synthase, partial [Candidatus Eisenbacteria bacterium]
APRITSSHRASTEALTFVHRTGVWDLSERPRVVGILNLTPDSFYDGGRFEGADSALDRAEAMASEGADAIDVGGQSTRPGSAPVGPEVEWGRVEPVLGSIVARVPLPVSIDTYHPDVARRALECGASIVNDVSGLGVAPSLADEAARAGAGLVLMHSLGAPGALHARRDYADVAAEVRAFLAERIRLAESRGVPRERIAIDPGIGFSKRAEQSVDALRGIPGLKPLGRPVYVGLSRKSFLGALTGEPLEGRLAAGLGAAVAAYALGARIFRTHDVRETVAALRLAETLLNPALAVTAEQGAGA